MPFRLLILITGEASSAKDNSSTLTSNHSFTGAAPQKPSLLLNRILINESTVILFSDSAQPLVIGPGRHRLDFNFSFSDKGTPQLTHLRCRLEGDEAHWITTTNGMALTCQVRDEKNEVISEVQFNAVGKRKGWGRDLYSAKFTHRSEPFYIPKEGRALYMAMSSGSSDVTGAFAIQDLQATLLGISSFTLHDPTGQHPRPCRRRSHQTRARDSRTTRQIHPTAERRH